MTWRALLISPYVEAVCEYAAALSTLQTLEGLTCAQALGQDLGSLLWVGADA
jgi:hypothetical protein